MEIVHLDEVEPYVTKDRSEIRELLAYRNSSIRNQSLAEARVRPGASTALHRHLKAEEIYFILQGRGLMQLADELEPVGPGDAVAIPPGVIHRITNTGTEELRFLCCCSPAYEHHETELIEQ